MSYFEGIEFFFFLAIALIIGFIINYLGRRIEVLHLSVVGYICRSYIWKKHDNVSVPNRFYPI